ncbi:hypothetical protein GCM10020367_55510 [Streptomyces sannanensis]|uniref:PE-PGRS family protein n=1 Tax=Streptomyces sannanensis TaxID=285536 RepID=A0ABP6SIR2_9ACTN
MRMFFEPDDEDGFAVACEQLAHHVADRSRTQGGDEADPFVVESALEYRHGGTVDGRLGLWQARHVEEFLLDWLPRTLTRLPGEPPTDEPGGLRTLLRYLDATGLADPRGDALDVLERAVDAAAGQFEAAMADRTRWGMAKFWATTAAEQGVDIHDQAAMTRFTERARRDEVPYDHDALDAIMARHLRADRPRTERSEPQLPVTLPDEDELRAQAAEAPPARQLAGLADWAGPEGRELTKRGRLRIADAKELVATLETGDRADSPRTSAELPRLHLVFEWAKKARLVRVAKGRVYAVAKARPLLADPLALWQRAFETVFELREPLLGDVDGYRLTSMLYDVYEDVLPDVLNTLYSLPYPMPWPRLRDSVHVVYRMRYDLDNATADEQRRWLLSADHDLRHVLDSLERLGAISREQGMADPVYLELPAPETTPVPSPRPPAGTSPELAALLVGRPAAPDPQAEAARAKRLSAELADGPVELIRLTDLGTYGVRQRLLAEGRSAPLVGELAHAQAAGLLGVLAEHYDPDSARAELAAWTAAHGAPEAARAELLGAVRRMPFRVRAAAMLDALTAALPEGDGEEVLRSLRADTELAPTALSVLTHRETLTPEDLTEREAHLMVAESLLQLLEAAGEHAFLDTVLSGGRGEAETAIQAALSSGHPDHTGLEQLRRIAEGRLRARSAQLGRLNAARARRGRTPPKRKRRR